MLDVHTVSQALTWARLHPLGLIWPTRSSQMQPNYLANCMRGVDIYRFYIADCTRGVEIQENYLVNCMRGVHIVIN